MTSQNVSLIMIKTLSLSFTKGSKVSFKKWHQFYLYPTNFSRPGNFRLMLMLSESNPTLLHLSYESITSQLKPLLNSP